MEAGPVPGHHHYRSLSNASQRSLNLSLQRTGSSASVHSRALEAAHIKDILRRHIVYLTGGRDRRGGPVIIFPRSGELYTVAHDDVVSLINYLASLPSKDSSDKGFTVIIDNTDTLYTIKTTVSTLQECMGSSIYVVYVVQGDKSRRTLSFRREKGLNGIEMHHVSLPKLKAAIQPNQLWEDLGGTLHYSHEIWIEQRLGVEKFMKECRLVSNDLERTLVSISERLRQDDNISPQQLLQQHRSLQESVIYIPEKTIRHGRELYSTFQREVESNTAVDEEPNYTLDQVTAMNAIKQQVELLESQLDRIHALWRDRQMSLGAKMQLSEMEQAMNTVVEWILGPAEKLLASQVDIGDSYKTADELRKQHEQLELKCTDSYATYAELRHKTNDTSSIDHDKWADITALRDYMDTICRSFAARLERRRNLIITSVRFHRLLDQLWMMFENLERWLSPNTEYPDVTSVQEALTLLQDKCQETNVTAEAAYNEGQNLLDQLSLPVKNAFGQDVSPDNTHHTQHVEKCLARLQQQHGQMEDLFQRSRLRFQQILQLRQCEANGNQALVWLEDLFTVSMHGMSHPPQTADDHLATAKHAYEYGVQLLEAGLVLRRSLGFDLEPNTVLAAQLAEAWRKFSYGLNEKNTILSAVDTFNKKLDMIQNNLEELLTALSQVINSEITVETMLVRHSPLKASTDHAVQEVASDGEQLLSQLDQEQMLNDTVYDKKSGLNYAEVESEVRNGLKHLQERYSMMTEHWLAQTRNQLVYGQSETTQRAVSVENVSQETRVVRSQLLLVPANQTPRSEWDQLMQKMKDSHDWIRVRIQQMEPDLMEVGASLDEAKSLRREHDLLISKLQAKQTDVAEILARADDLATQNQSYQQVYTAMAGSLSEAWKDLNGQLEHRKTLLDQSIAFHEAAHQFSDKMEMAQERFAASGPPRDVDTARQLLQQHDELKKMILEQSMYTLTEGQTLLERIRQMAMHADVQNRHATTAACYGIEHLLELLQDRRRHLEELWQTRRIRLEHCLQLLLLDLEVNKVSKWFEQVGDAYLNQKDLGDSQAAVQNLQQQHTNFEQQAREVQDTVLRLLRTADHVMHSSDQQQAESVHKRLLLIDQKSEDFMLRLDTRRKNLTLAANFFSLAQTALQKLGEVEAELTSMDLPRNSAALAERHAYLSSAIVEVSTHALREGSVLLERVGREHPGVQGVVHKVEEIETRCTQLEDMCKARYEAGQQSQEEKAFADKYNQLNSWLIKIGLGCLSQYPHMGTNLSLARDFLEIHERLDEDLTGKQGEVDELCRMGEALAEASGDRAASEQATTLREQWNLLHTNVEQRIRLAIAYVAFHKKAQQLAIQMDAIEQYLKIEKFDPSEITDSSIQHKENKYREMDSQFGEVESKGKAFIKQANETKDDLSLSTQQAITIVETILSQFMERKYVITDYYENWQVHVTTGREFKSQWHQFVQDARKTIDWVMRAEDDFFPMIAGQLGSSLESTQQYQQKLEEFSPTVKKAQEEMEGHLKTAELLALKGDTGGQREQIVNELLRVHTRFQARIAEYKILLNMTVKFFENLQKLDELIEKTEQEYQQAELPQEVSAAEVELREHQLAKEKMEKMIDFSHEEGEQIVIRVRQQDSETVAKDEVQKVLHLTESRRSTWEQAWEERRTRLEASLQLAQFYADLRQLHKELDELHRQLNARRGNYGSSLSSCKLTLQAFKQFENSLQGVENKVKTFTSTAEMMINQEHYDSRRIRHEVEGVQRKWEEFYGSISAYRTSLDDSTVFFETMDECETWINESSQYLLQIGRGASDCRSSQDATELMVKLQKFKDDKASEQDKRLQHMSSIAVQLYGPVQGPQKMQHIVDHNQDLMASFHKAAEELAILKDNLAKKEAILVEMDSVVESKTPRVPRFVVPLQNAELREGQRFTFECRLECDSTSPKIEWFKDNLPITTPDYETTYREGLCQLTIEETFSEDSAKWSCKATTENGTAETSGTLKVKAVQKPYIEEPLQNATCQEGQSVKLTVRFGGEPAPQIQWLRNDTPILPSAVYKITLETNTTSLEVRQAFPEDSGTYTVIARNMGGEARTSCTVTIQVVESTAREPQVATMKPTITKPLTNKEVMEGSRARLDCVVVARPEPEVVWYHNQKPVKESKDFQLLFEGDKCSLVIQEVYLEDSGDYCITASNRLGKADSKCRLTVEPLSELSDVPSSQAEVVPPKFTQLLRDLDVPEGQRVKLECRVIGHPSPKISWFKGNQELKPSTDFHITSSRELHCLTIPEVFHEDSGNFMVKATNSAGEAKCYASLRVRAPSETRIVKTRLVESSHTIQKTTTLGQQAPEFKTLFSDSRVRPGEPFKFEVVITGTPKPKVQWLFNNEPIVSPDYQISSLGDTHTLYIPEVFDEDAGRFAVVADNNSGKATCSALLVVADDDMEGEEPIAPTQAARAAAPVKFPPPPPKAPSPAPVLPQTSPAVERKMFDLPRQKYSPVPAPKPVAPPAPKPVAPPAPKPVAPPAPKPVAPPAPKPAPPPPPQPVEVPWQQPTVRKSPSPAPQFRETLTRSPQTKPKFQQVDFTIEVPIPPQFVDNLKNIASNEGTRVTFQGSVKGKPQPTIKWFKEGKEITDSADFQISYQNNRVTLTIPEIFEEDAGKFTCTAQNEAGSVSSSAELIVKASMVPPEFYERLHTKEIKEGDSVKFTVRVSGKPSPDVTWYREGTQITSSPDFEIEQKGDVHSLYIPEVFYEDSGKFTVKADSRGGHATCTAELIVEAPSAHEESVSPSPPVSRSPSLGLSPDRSRSALYTPQVFQPRPQMEHKHVSPVKTIPQFTKPLAPQKVREGHKVTLQCAVPSYPLPERVQWYRNEIDIKPSTDYQISFSQGVCTLVICEVFPEDAGRYSCTVYINGVPNTTSMVLDVQAAPTRQPQAPPQPPAPKKIPEKSPRFLHELKPHPLRYGQTAYFECKVDGHPPPEILWTRKGHPLVDKTRYKSTYDQYTGITTLTILDLCKEDEGEYTCTAINTLGEVSTTATLMSTERFQDWEQQKKSPSQQPYSPSPQMFSPQPQQQMPYSPQPQQQMRYSPQPQMRYSPQPQQQMRFSPQPQQKQVPFSPQPQQQKQVPYSPQPVQQMAPSPVQHRPAPHQMSKSPTPTRSSLYKPMSSEPAAASPTPSDGGFKVSSFETRLQKEVEFRGGRVHPQHFTSDDEAFDEHVPRDESRQPVFTQKLSNFQLMEGSDVMFICKVDGYPRPNIQWFQNGRLIRPSKHFEMKLTKDGYVSLRIHEAYAEDEGHYTCCATNVVGRDACSAELYQGTLSKVDDSSYVTPETLKRITHTPIDSRSHEPGGVSEKYFRPVFRKVPSDQEVNEGQMCRFDCIVSGRPHPEILWYRDGVQVFEDRLHNIVINEEGINSLIIHATTRNDSGQYTCIARNRAGEDSFQVHLNVTPKQARAPPRFIKKPENQSVREGEPTSFHAEAVGVPVPLMSWQKDGRMLTDAPDHPYRIETKGAFTSLYVDRAAPEDNAWFQCTAANVAGIATNRAKLVVQVEPRRPTPERKLSIPRKTITTPSSDPAPAYKPRVAEDEIKVTPKPPVFQSKLKPLMLKEGEPAHFEARLNPVSDPHMEVEWFKDGEPIRHGSKFVPRFEFGFVALDIKYTYPEDSGTYSVQAKNKDGDITMSAPLTCTPLDSIDYGSQLPESSTGVARLQAMEDIAAKRPSDEPSRQEPVHTGIGAQPSEEDMYNQQKPRPPKFKTSPKPLPNLVEGQSAHFECRLVPVGDPTMDVQWYKNGEPVRHGHKFKPMYDFGFVALDLLYAYPEDSGTYTVKATNKHGTASVEVPLKCAPKDSILYDSMLPEGSTGLSQMHAMENFAPEAAMEIRDEPVHSGIGAEPSAQDMFSRDRPRPPKFKSQVKPLTNLVEGVPAHFECHLVPIGDPDMEVEWYKDGKVLRSGHKFKTLHDFGHVALDILYTYPEDSGTYTAIATNKYGSDSTQTQLHCYGKKSVITETQLPEGNKSMQHLEAMEENIRREMMPKERKEDEPEMTAPVFDLALEPQQVEEGDTAKFLIKVGGQPRPRLTWWINGTIIVNSVRFRLRYDGMIHILEIPKARDYDSGSVRVVAKNPMGEAECSTSLHVIPQDDWRSRLKKAPKSTAEVEMDKWRGPDQRTAELNIALKKPKTTVVELRAFERSTQEKALAYQDEEVKQAFIDINMQHAQMAKAKPGYYESTAHVDSEIHIARAKAMLNILDEQEREREHKKVSKTAPREREPPTFTKPLENVAAKEGQAVKMEVCFTGFPTATIQWLREGVEIHPSRDFQITNLFQKSFLVMPEVFPEDAGVFTVRAVNPLGMAECRAVLSVQEDISKPKETPPEFKVQMHNLHLKIGEPATLDTQVSGYPRPTVTWFKDGKKLSDSPRWKCIQEDDHCTLLIYEVRPEDQGRYECVVVNNTGKATCTSHLNVQGKIEEKKPAPQFVSHAAPKLVQPLRDQQVNEGDCVTFQLKVMAQPDPIIQWYYNNQLIKPSKYFQMESKDGVHSLTIAGAFPEDEGQYKCTALNQAGEVTCISHLKVTPLMSETEPEVTMTMEPPRFMQPIAGQDVVEGNPAELGAIVGGIPAPEVTWYREGHQITHSEDFQVVRDGNKYVLVIKEVFPEDAGIFTCRATNPAGVAECSAELFVQAEVAETTTQEVTTTTTTTTKHETTKLTIQTTKLEDAATSVVVQELEDTPVIMEHIPEDETDAELTLKPEAPQEVEEVAEIILKQEAPVEMVEEVTLKPEAPQEVEEVTDVTLKPEAPQEVEEVAEVTLKPEAPQEVEEVAEVTLKPEAPQEVEEVAEVTLKPEAPQEVEEVTEVTLKPEAPQEVEEVAEVTLKPEAPQEVEEVAEVTLKPEAPQEVQEVAEVTLKPEAPQEVEEVAEVTLKPEAPQEVEEVAEVTLKPEAPQEVEEEAEVTLKPEAPQEVEEVAEVTLKPEAPQEVEEVTEVTLKPEAPQEVEEVTEVTLKPEAPQEVEEVAEVTLKPEAPQEVEEVAEVTLKPEAPQEIEEVTFQPEVPQEVQEAVETTLKPEEPQQEETIEMSVAPEVTVEAEETKDEEYSGMEVNVRPEQVPNFDETSLRLALKQEIDQTTHTQELEINDEITLETRVTEVKTLRMELSELGGVSLTETTEVKTNTDMREAQKTTERDQVVITRRSADEKTQHGLPYCEEPHGENCPMIMPGDHNELPVGTVAPINPAMYIALSAYEPENDDVMSLHDGERLELMEDPNDEWCLVRKLFNQHQGWVPGQYLRSQAQHVQEIQAKIAECIEQHPFESHEDMIGIPKAPTVTRYLPHNLAITDGTSIQLECYIKANPAPMITWFRESTVIAPSPDFMQFYDENGCCSLDIKEVFPEDTGIYTVVAKNVHGVVTSSVELIVTENNALTSVEEVDDRRAPSVVQKPKSQVIDEGETAKFVCRIDAKPEPQMLWYKDGVEITPAANRFVVDTSQEVDTYTTMLTVHNTEMTDGGKYTMIATNGMGEITVAVSLIVKEIQKKVDLLDTIKKKEKPTKPEEEVTEPEVSSSPSAAAAAVPAQHDFRHLLHHPTPESLHASNEPILDPFMDNSSFSLPKPLHITPEARGHNVKSNQMDFRGVLSKKQNEPRHEKRDKESNLQKDFRHVLHKATTPASAKPVTEMHKAEQIDFCGVLKKARDDDDEESQVSGSQGSDAASVDTVRLSSLRTYESEKDNERVSSAVSMITDNQSVITDFGSSDVTEWPDVNSHYGSEFTHDASLTSEDDVFPESSREVQLNQEALNINPHGNESGLHGDESGLHGSLQSAPVLHEKPKDVTVQEGESARFMCTVSCMPPPQITWYFLGRPVFDDDVYKLEASEDGQYSLFLPEVLLEDVGLYTVRASNSGGMIEASAMLYVTEATTELTVEETVSQQQEVEVPQKIEEDEVDASLTQPEPEEPTEVTADATLTPQPEPGKGPRFKRALTTLSVNLQQPIILECQLESEPAPEVVWYKDGVEIVDERCIVEITDDLEVTLTIYESRVEDGGDYTIRAFNPYGEITDTVDVTIIFEAPGFDETPTDITVTIDSDASFECTFHGTPAPTAQWTRSGVDIVQSDKYTITSDDTSSILDIFDLTLEDTEVEYTITITNPVGHDTSSGRLILPGWYRMVSLTRAVAALVCMMTFANNVYLSQPLNVKPTNLNIDCYQHVQKS